MKSAGFAFVFCAALATGQQTAATRDAEAPRMQLTNYLTTLGLKQLAERDAAIEKLKSREDVEARKKVVREKMLRLIGGLPEYRGPLNVKQIGTLDRGDYRIEKIIYESLPGFYVPANVYIPAKQNGPFPAVLMPVGHSVGGKDGERQTAVNLAIKGFVVLKYDPLGQGERFQYYDPELRASKVGSLTDEHSHANGHTLLIGDSVAKYRIWDGMRGIDYLVSRKDVDPNRIGCTGCSGGGTLTTYISALDNRVKVAAPACYITSWQELLTGPGPQDGEQVFPRFLAESLNIADFVELFAPKPWLIANTIQDFFPLEGARQTYAEARKIYELYGAGDRVQWFIGPGGHGTPLPTREALYAWFIKWLKDGKGDPQEIAVKLDPPEALLCTKTGQVSDSLGGETVYSLNKKRAADLIAAKPPISSAADVDQLRSKLIKDIREIAAISVQPGEAPPRVRVLEVVDENGYRIESLAIASEGGTRIPAVLLIPDSGGAKPAILVADARSKQPGMVRGSELEELARGGNVVLAIQPRGVSEPIGERRGSFLGEYGLACRANLVGKSLVGMRAEDIIRSVDYLVSRPEVDRTRIAALAQGSSGVPVLHAAVLDERIGRLVLSQTLASYRLGVDRPIHRNLYDVAIPGVLRKYDLDELLAAVSPRPVTLVNPVDQVGRTLYPNEFQELCRYAFEADRSTGKAGRVTVVNQGLRQGLLEVVSFRR